MRNLLRKQSEKFADLIFAAINGTFKNAEVNMHSGIYIEMQGEGVYVVMVSVMSNPDYSFICQLHQEDFYFIDEHVNDRNMWLSPLKKLLKEGRYFIFRKLDGTLLGEKLREKHIVEHKKEEERESHREYYANIGLMSSISEQNREYEKGNFEFD